MRQSSSCRRTGVRPRCRKACGSTTSATPAPACLSPRARALKPCRRSWGMRPPASRSTPTGTCSRPRWRRSPTAWRWSETPPWQSGHGPSADPPTTVWGKPQVGDPVSWRRLRGSNPRGSCPPTRFPGVCLRPLGQASAAQSSQPRHPPATRRRGKDGIRTHGCLATSTVFETHVARPGLSPVVTGRPGQGRVQRIRRF